MHTAASAGGTGGIYSTEPLSHTYQLPYQTTSPIVLTPGLYTCTCSYKPTQTKQDDRELHHTHMHVHAGHLHVLLLLHAASACMSSTTFDTNSVTLFFQLWR